MKHMQALAQTYFNDTGSGRKTDVLICSRGDSDTTMAFMASLDVKTAFDVARPAVVSKIHTLTGVHGLLTAALLAKSQTSVAPQALKTARQISGTLGTHRQTRALESGREMASQRLEIILWRGPSRRK